MPIYLVKENKKGADIMVLRKDVKYPKELINKRISQGYKKVSATDKLTAIEKVTGVKFKKS
jgi:hypothetical protein